MVKKDAPGTEKLLLKERGGKFGIHFAVLSAEDMPRFKDMGWMYEPDSSVAYRELTVNGQKRRSFLHREAAGCVFGDGKNVYCKDGDKLNCARSNLEVGQTVRKLNTSPEGKFLPRKKENFVSYVTKHFKTSQLYNFLQIAEITNYNTREIRFSAELEDNKPISGVQSVIQKFLETEFAFKGRVAVVRKPIELLDAKHTERSVPAPAAVSASSPTAIAVIPTLKPEPMHMPETAAITSVAPAAIMARIHELSKAGNIDFLSFGVRDGGKLHKFNYTCEDLPTATQ